MVEVVVVVVNIKSMGFCTAFRVPGQPSQVYLGRIGIRVHSRCCKSSMGNSNSKSSLPDDQARSHARNDKLLGTHVALGASLVPGKVSSRKDASRVHLLHTSLPA